MPPRSAPVEVVDPRWVLKALIVCVLAAAVCGYGAICLLLYQGAWQILLHPVKNVARTPADAKLAFDAVRFDAAETGTPRLAAWWVPAGDQDAPTILLLHDGHGSLADTVPLLAVIHEAGLNVFAFDYRGFGESDPEHPSEAHMAEDSAAALDYLVSTRHLPAATIIPCGIGLGASLATTLAATHPLLPAIIIDNPDPDAGQRVIAAEQSRFIPVSLLLQDRFDLKQKLTALQQPELLIVGGPDDTERMRDRDNLTFFRSLPGHRMILDLQPPSEPAPSAAQNLSAALDRFLGEYLPTGAAPKPASPMTPAAPAPQPAAAKH
jgi:pimeloyl-ACP methyl ester carboxylesterase